MPTKYQLDFETNSGNFTKFGVNLFQIINKIPNGKYHQCVGTIEMINHFLKHL